MSYYLYITTCYYVIKLFHPRYRIQTWDIRTMLWNEI